jgi:purine-nucleoside phosphorylase
MAAITEATYQTSAEYLTSNLPKEFHNVELGVICGSGLGGLVDTIDQSSKVEFLYKDIPGFVASTGKKIFFKLKVQLYQPISKSRSSCGPCW